MVTRVKEVTSNQYLYLPRIMSLGGEMMMYDIGKSDKILVNMQNSQQNRPRLKSLDSG